MIKRIILPSALPGVMTGLILAMARGAGEVAPLMVTGVVKLAPSLPIDGEGPFIHLERKFMHLGFHIYDVGFQSPDSDAAHGFRHHAAPHPAGGGHEPHGHPHPQPPAQKIRGLQLLTPFSFTIP